MSVSEADRLRELVAQCLDRLEREGASAIDAFCRDHPDDAAAIRARLEFLERSALLERPRGADPAALPERLGDFRLLRKLGEGGMGVVYLARQESLGREVALKLVRPDQLWFSGARERFRREVEAIARLQHPGVVPIHAVGEEAGIPFFAMENVAGATLADAIAALAGEDVSRLQGHDLGRAIALRSGAAEGRPGDSSAGFAFDGTWTEACFRIVRQVAEALDHVHRRGVLHRDLKPSNVMVTRAGRAMLLDFGLASTEGASRLTRSGTRLGSLPYLAPEQWRGKAAGGAADPVDARTDVYALGVTLYELLTLRVPYADPSAEALLRAIEVGRPQGVRALNRSVPWDAETVCLTAMERDPARRYASAADFARDLDNVLHKRPIEARRPGVALRARRWLQRHPALGVGVVLGSLLLIGGPTTVAWLEHASRVSLDRSFRRADGLRLSGESTALLATDPGLALLIAIEGARRQPGAAANDALLAALAACHEEHSLSGHVGGVELARFSPDGATVATASPDGTAILWDARTGAATHVLVGHADAVRSVAFDPSGRRLLTASSDGQARLWEVATGACLRVLRGGCGALVGAAFDGDGARSLTWSADGSAQIWDVAGESGAGAGAAGPAPRRTLSDAGGELADASFSPDGRLVVTAAADGRARLFDAESGACVRRLELGGAVWRARFSPDGGRVALCGKANAARVFDVASGREALPPLQHADLIATVEWSSDGTRLLTAGWDHVVGVWDAQSGERRLALHGLRRIARFARFSPDGTLVLAGGDDATAHLWSASSGREFAVLRGHRATVNAGGFSRDGRHVVTAADEAKLWSVPAAALRREWEGHRDKVQGVAVARDGRRFVTASRDGTARIWDVETLRLERTLAGHAGRVNAASISPDGSAVVTASDDETARVWDAASGAGLAVLRGHRGALTTCRFDATGERVLTSSLDGTTRMWDWRAARELRSFPGPKGPVIGEDLSDDGTRLVTLTRDGLATAFDTETGQVVARFGEAGGGARLARFTPDPRRVLIGTLDRTVWSWDLATNRHVALLHGRGGKLQSLAVSSDGRHIVTSGDDTAIRLWDAASGEAVATLVGHEELVPFTAFSADGTQVVSASIDGDVRRRPVDPLAAALAARPRELSADEHVALEVGDVAAWREAEERVRALAESCVLASDLLAAVRAAGLKDEALAAALAIAGARRDAPLELIRASSLVVRAKGRSEADYALALRRAEAAGRLYSERDEIAACALLACRALAAARLGRADEARELLGKLRARAAEEKLAAPAIAPWLREAEAAIE